jgi:putative oxygen-independent coproporphyrinogen III oxidase
MQLPPLSLYVHIPWCIKKCPYCDFNSHTSNEPIPEKAYVSALKQDLSAAIPAAQGRPVASIFFGGGTPSLFSADSIHTILDSIRQSLVLADNAEITLEANPGTVEQARFTGYREAGVNRISLGAQSFNDRHLQALGRIHSGADIHRAIDTASKAGFDAINIDLMYGLPEQTVAQGLQDITRAIEHQPGHISWYELTIEPNTVFYNKPPTTPREAVLMELEGAGQRLLADAGYRRYEISAYSASPEQASTHNLNYWRFGDYLGLGAGAHGKITYVEQRRIVREWKTRSPRDYLRPDAPLIAGRRDLDAGELPLEFMMNALRLIEGVPEDYFAQRTGMTYDAIAQTVAQLCAQGMMREGRLLCTTGQGNRYLDSVLQTFVDDESTLSNSRSHTP